jgi:poly(beta-D-mannuronate) lyase
MRTFFLSLIVLMAMVGGVFPAMSQEVSVGQQDVLPESNGMDDAWLKAEMTPLEGAGWSDLYDRMNAGEALPEGVSADTLVMNMVYAALMKGHYAVAEELTDNLSDPTVSLFSRLYILRQKAVKDPSDSDEEALLGLLPEAKEKLSYPRYFHWTAALATALLDASEGKPFPAAVNVLLEEQMISRHRAYLLHRIALRDSALTERAAAMQPLDLEALQKAMKAGAWNDAYHLLATSALSQKNATRNKAIIALHEAVRDTDKDGVMALRALWLIDKDNAQNKALLRYLEWLADKGKVTQAVSLAETFPEGALRVQAYHRLREMFKASNMIEYRKKYERKIVEQEGHIRPSSLPHMPEVAFKPFKRWNKEGVLFDVNSRSEQLKSGKIPHAATFCMSKPVPKASAGTPIEGFRSVGEYGMDRRAQAFSWEVMVLTGRVLLGESASRDRVAALLLEWAKAKAFSETDDTLNAYFPLKRVLLPIIIAMDVLQPLLKPEENKALREWIAPLIGRTDRYFDGDVDRNNHRYLTDTAQMAWGIFTQDVKKYHQGMVRFNTALSEMTKDGALPLEVRRGARATWYMRQSLASLTTIAVMAERQGDDLFAVKLQGKSLQQMLSYWINIVYNPMLIFPDAAENITPGYHYNVFEQDQGMLKPRGATRHYMAFAEQWLRRHENAMLTKRLRQLMQQKVVGARPYIDEFSGGNISCFYEQH